MDFRLTDAVIKIQVKGRAVVSHTVCLHNTDCCSFSLCFQEFDCRPQS